MQDKCEGVIHTNMRAQVMEGDHGGCKSKGLIKIKAKKGHVSSPP